MTVSASKLVPSLAVLGALAAAAASPRLLGPHVASALGALRGADRGWAAVAVAALAVSFAANVGAWRAALRAAGGRIGCRQLGARLGVGALVNAVAPAKLGDAVKVALCARALEGRDRIWTASGVYAGIGAAHALALAALVVVASATGAAPLWPVFALCGLVALVGAVALSSPRWRRHHRVQHLLEGCAALARSPRVAAAVVGWTTLGAIARLASVAAVAAALGLPSPILAALVILPAMDLAGTIPITPGSLGVASGAAALALRSRGIAITDAIGVGLSIQALQTTFAVVTGSASALYLAQPNGSARRWAGRAVAVAAPAALVAVVGVFVLDWA